MVHGDDVVVGRRGRKRRSLAEKLAIVQLTMQPDASVAEIARAHGVNANQVFTWRRLFEKGKLVAGRASSTALLPVTVSADTEPESGSVASASDVQTSSSGTIHIELLGKALISAESGADPALLRCVLESLRQ